MRVFISWSGDLSEKLAQAIRRWLPSTLQFVKPYFTPSDVDKGARWANEISRELSESKFGIIVLTPDNLHNPWINFEAGAISRIVEQGKVCPIVFNMAPTDVDWPLAQFQATRFDQDDIHKLFNTINASAGDNRLADPIADTVFDKWWPDLETEINKILNDAASVHAPGEVRQQRELIEEVLSLVRGISSRQEEIEHSRQMAEALRASPLSIAAGGLIPGTWLTTPVPRIDEGSYPWVPRVEEGPFTQALRGTRDKVAAIHQTGKTAEAHTEKPKESKNPDKKPGS